MRANICFVVIAVTAALMAACGSSKSTGGGSLLDGGTSDSGLSAGGVSGSSTGGNGGSGASTGGSANAGSGGRAMAADSGTRSGDSGADGAVDSGPPLGPYPAGPYGNTLGATMRNLPLQGYVNGTGDVLSNTLPWVPAYALEDVRESRVPYLLVHVSEFNCSGCRHAAKQLGIDGKGILDAGGGVVEILSAKGGQPTNRADLDAWITTANENVSSFIDATSDPTGALKMAGIRETAFIIKVPSMKIVWVLHGDVTGATPPSIVTAAAEMHKLLGK